MARSNSYSYSKNQGGEKRKSRSGRLVPRSVSWSDENGKQLATERPAESHIESLRRTDPAKELEYPENLSPQWGWYVNVTPSRWNRITSWKMAPQQMRQRANNKSIGIIYILFYLA